VDLGRIDHLIVDKLILFSGKGNAIGVVRLSVSPSVSTLCL